MLQTFSLRIPRGCSVGFRSGDVFDQSIPFTLSFWSKAAVVSEVCLGLLSCWNGALQPGFNHAGHAFRNPCPGVSGVQQTVSKRLPSGSHAVLAGSGLMDRINPSIRSSEFFTMSCHVGFTAASMRVYESDNTKFNTPTPHSHLRPCNTNSSHNSREEMVKWAQRH